MIRKNIYLYVVLLFHQLRVLHVICPTRLGCVMSGLLDITTTLPRPAAYTSGTAAALATATTLPLWRRASRPARTRGLSPHHTAPIGAKSGQVLAHLSNPIATGFNQRGAGQRKEMCRLAALITGKSAV